VLPVGAVAHLRDRDEPLRCREPNPGFDPRTSGARAEREDGDVALRVQLVEDGDPARGRRQSSGSRR
jgi:hypothetical protein